MLLHLKGIRVLESNWLCLTNLHHWLKEKQTTKKKRHFIIQSEVKPKPIVTRWHTFSLALGQLHLITSSFDWFTVLSVSFAIGQSAALLDLVLRHLVNIS